LATITFSLALPHLSSALAGVLSAYVKNGSQQIIYGSLGIPGVPTIACDPDVGHFDHESYVSRHQALWRKSKLIGRQPVSRELDFR
jgi:hypothetical protein